MVPIYALLLTIPLVACRSVERASFARSSGAATAAPGESQPTPSSVAIEHVESGATPTSLSRWPARWGNNPTIPGIIRELDPTLTFRPAHLSRYHTLRSSNEEYFDAGMLASALGFTTGFEFLPEAPGSYVFYADPADPDGEPNPNAPDLAFKFISAEKTLDLSPGADPAQDHVLLQRTWFTYHDPKTKEPDAEPIGTIILLPGMFGTPEPIVDAFERYWKNQGYAILRMLSHPSRFTQHQTAKVFPGTEELVASNFTRESDNRVAEGAYATKAALDHLYSKRPALSDKPAILIGMSGGAMMLPTVYAYAPDHYDGAVLIAGGADYLTIAIESNYKDWIDAFVFDFEPDSISTQGNPTPEQLKELSSIYLGESKLDAFHTATEMHDVPVLMLHATADNAVPSSTGELLYQQLGKPERWTYPVGHELIFAALPTQVSRIDKWITAHVINPETHTPDD